MELIFGYLQQGLSAIIPFIVLLGLLIFVHELGHFLVAKFFGVRVEVFSLGFGKKILSYKKGDTTYCISIVPLGGYVKMFGDELGSNITEEEKKFAFNHKPVSQRIAVVLAGPLMNFFFTILIFLVVCYIGEDVKSSVLGDVEKHTAAYAAGFRSGDKIVKADSKEIRTWQEVQDYMTEKNGTPISFQVQRETGGQVETLQATPSQIENPNILTLSSKIGNIDGLSGNTRAAYIGVRGKTFAEKSGLRTGDKITAINGNKINSYREIENSILSLQGQDITFQIERTSPQQKNNESEKSDVKLAAGKFSSLASLGIESPDLFLYQVVKDSPAEKAGLQAGDRLLKVDSKEVATWEDVLNTVKSFSGEGEINFFVDRAGETINFGIVPQFTTHTTAMGAEEKRFTVGIVPSIFIANPEIIKIKSSGFGDALQRSVTKTVDVTVMTVMSFVRLVQNKISPKNLGGVISIGQAASETYKMGLVHFLQMMAIISINLFILNLLPIPVLDGGHLVFYTIEAIKGAPMSIGKVEIAQKVGLVVLMSLMVLSLFNDFSRILGSW